MIRAGLHILLSRICSPSGNNPLSLLVLLNRIGSMLGFIIALSCAFTIFIITTIVVCIRRKQKAARNVGYTLNDAPVVVTSATHTAPGGYPVTQLPPPGYQTNVYGTPYPGQMSGNVTVQMPMPMPMPQGVHTMPGMQTHGMPAYPMPQPGAGASCMNPPSYDMAVSGGVPTGGYEKQSPYNPSYAAQ